VIGSNPTVDHPNNHPLAIRGIVPEAVGTVRTRKNNREAENFISQSHYLFTTWVCMPLFIGHQSYSY